jgi:class 3 adenylate cyclase
VNEATPATATFLFTDIEGSTELLKSHRDAYASILADHHRILRDVFTAHGGREVDNQGDSFFVAFTRARNAVLAAADIQRALTTHTWASGAAVRVRMGIHTGEADLTADRYVGLSVHRAARISALGHGGQVLVSPTTAGLLEDEAALPGVFLRSLGKHRLKDIERPVEIYQLEVEGLPGSFPPLRSGPKPPNRRLRVGLATAALLLITLGGIAAVWASRAEPPPEVLPDSLVRIDPDTLEPTDVFPVGPGADLVVDSGGYIWITHFVLRDADSDELRDAGDRTVTRVDPSTGEVRTVGGGLAPCGLAPDPSGDVWIANCFTSGQDPSVVRIDAESLKFDATWFVPGDEGFVRALAYGGGALWVSNTLGEDTTPGRGSVTQVDPETGARKVIEIGAPFGWMAWSEGYGDLWANDFVDGSTVRLHAATGSVETVRRTAAGPSGIVVRADAVWVGDWDTPQVTRIPAVGSPVQQHIALPVGPTTGRGSAVWLVDANSSAVWATTPRFGALWKIDPETDAVTEIPLPYLPSGVAAAEDAVWVTVRGE